MDEETKAAFADVSAALGTINTMLADIVDNMATKAELAAIMARMNDGFDLTQRVTRLEQDVRQLRQLRGGI